MSTTIRAGRCAKRGRAWAASLRRGCARRGTAAAARGRGWAVAARAPLPRSFRQKTVDQTGGQIGQRCASDDAEVVARHRADTLLPRARHRPNALAGPDESPGHGGDRVGVTPQIDPAEDGVAIGSACGDERPEGEGHCFRRNIGPRGDSTVTPSCSALSVAHISIAPAAISPARCSARYVQLSRGTCASAPARMASGLCPVTATATPAATA